MKLSSSHAAALAALALVAGSSLAGAQTPAPGFFGLQHLALRGNSDTMLAFPFARREMLATTVASVSGAVITVPGATTFTASEFVPAGAQVDTYYALITSGVLRGQSFTVTANTANTLTLDLAGGALTGLAAGDQLSLVPYWTLATLFPAGAGVHASPTATDRRTEVLVPNPDSTGINTPEPRIYYYVGGHWQELGAEGSNRDHEPLLPDGHVIVRHNVPADTEWLAAGNVFTSDFAVTVGASTGSRRDNYLGLPRPNAVTLADSGLIQSGAFKASVLPGTRTDELLVFDNTQLGKNKSAAAVYYYWNGAWRKVGAAFTATFDNAPVFTPGAGFIIRKGAAATVAPWQNPAGY